MKTTRLAFLALLLAAPVAPTAARADAVGAAVAALAPEIEEVRFVGDWQQDDAAGTYRIIVTRTGTEKLAARVFVQWIAFADSGASVKATVEIAELEALGLDVRETSAEMDGDKLIITFELAGDTADKGGTYEAIVTAPDDYRFQKAGN